MRHAGDVRGHPLVGCDPLHPHQALRSPIRHGHLRAAAPKLCHPRSRSHGIGSTRKPTGIESSDIVDMMDKPALCGTKGACDVALGRSRNAWRSPARRSRLARTPGIKLVRKRAIVFRRAPGMRKAVARSSALRLTHATRLVPVGVPAGG